VKKTRLKSTDIGIGAPIAIDAYDEAGRLLLARGELVTSASQIDRLLSTIGHYPPAALVSLANGEITVVLRQFLTSRQPVARAVATSQGKAIAGFPKRLTSNPTYAVRQVLRDKLLGNKFDIGMLWHDIVVEGGKSDDDGAST
jgi:hypothetical protein